MKVIVHEEVVCADVDRRDAKAIDELFQAVSDPNKTPQHTFKVHVATVDGKPAWLITAA